MRIKKSDKRCMTCKHWKPIAKAIGGSVPEMHGKCHKSRKPIFKLPNYVCKDWEFWRET